MHATSVIRAYVSSKLRSSRCFKRDVVPAWRLASRPPSPAKVPVCCLPVRAAASSGFSGVAPQERPPLPPLLQAAVSGDAVAARAALAELRRQATAEADELASTALFLACLHGHESLVALLLGGDGVRDVDAPGPQVQAGRGVWRPRRQRACLPSYLPATPP